MPYSQQVGRIGLQRVTEQRKAAYGFSAGFSLPQSATLSRGATPFVAHYLVVPVPRYLRSLFATAAIVVAGCGTQVEPSSGKATAPASGTFPVGFSPETDVLSAGGYTLTFTLPVIGAGAPTTIHAELQTLPPAGISPPQFVERGKALASGGGVKCDVTATYCVADYFSVVPDGPITFNSDPTLQYTLPEGTTIAAGSNALLYYSQDGGHTWSNSSASPVNPSGAGTISSVACDATGQYCTVAGFAGLPGIDTLDAHSTDVYALVVTPQAPTP